MLGFEAGASPLPFMASVERSSVFQPVLAGTQTAAPEASTSDNDEQLLDVFYALAGTGVVAAADGTVRRISAGDSLLAWHGKTTLHSLPDEQPPVILRFHLPASVLMLPPGATVAPSPSHAGVQVMVDECSGPQDGELSHQEAESMLHGVASRAANALTALYEQPEPPQRPAALAPAPAHHAPVPPAGPASPRNNAVPLLPFLCRLLHRGDASAGPHDSDASLQAGPPRATGAAAGPGPRSESAAAPEPSKRPRPSPRRHGAQAEQPPATPPKRPEAVGGVLLQRALEEFKAFKFPRQTNKLAFVFDPQELGLSLSFGVEVIFAPRGTALRPVHASWRRATGARTRCARAEGTASRLLTFASRLAHAPPTRRCLSQGTRRPCTCTAPRTSCSSCWPARAWPRATVCASLCAPATAWSSRP